MKLSWADAGLPASTRLWSLPAFTPHRRGWASGEASRAGPWRGPGTAASRPNAQSGAPSPPNPPFPSVSKTSFHRPWSWTPFLLSIAAASWVSPHRSPPRPSPGETSTGAGRGHPPEHLRAHGTTLGWEACARSTWGAGSQPPPPPLAPPSYRQRGGGVAGRPRPIHTQSVLGPRGCQEPTWPLSPTHRARGYLPLYGIVTGLLLRGEALILLLRVVICRMSKWKGKHLDIPTGVLAMRRQPEDGSPGPTWAAVSSPSRQTSGMGQGCASPLPRWPLQASDASAWISRPAGSPACPPTPQGTVAPIMMVATAMPGPVPRPWKALPSSP